MLKSQPLIDKICCRISAGGMSDLVNCQTNNALIILNSNPVISVANVGSLPSANSNLGRLIYVNDINKYYFGTQFGWESDLDSTLEIFATPAVTWGTNICGSLGINSSNTGFFANTATAVVGCIDFRCVAGGGKANHFVGIDTCNRAWSWGSSQYSSGALGDGFAIDRSSPVSVLGGFTDWTKIETAQSHTIGLRSNGTIWTWGTSGTGELGNNTITPRSSPGTIVGGFTDWCDISATSGIRTNGTLWVWGSNFSGQIGDNTTICRSSPVSVVGGFTDWSRVSKNRFSTIGLRSNGTIWSWGCNNLGQLGDNTVICRSSPVSVVGGFTDWCSIASGSDHSLALRTNGSLWAWGFNSAGQLGDCTTSCRSSPVSVVGGFTDWCHIAPGFTSSGGVRTNGTLWTWGYTSNGAGGGVYNRVSPIRALPNFTDITNHASNRNNIALAVRAVCKGF